MIIFQPLYFFHFCLFNRQCSLYLYYYYKPQPLYWSIGPAQVIRNQLSCSVWSVNTWSWVSFLKLSQCLTVSCLHSISLIISSFGETSGAPPQISSICWSIQLSPKSACHSFSFLVCSQFSSPVVCSISFKDSQPSFLIRWLLFTYVNQYSCATISCPGW